MNTLRGLLAGSILGVGLALGSLAPANASVGATPAQSPPAPTNTVTGAPWSSPAYPVDCHDASGQVSCTPTDPAAVTAEQCFTGVLYEGQQATVCTTFQGHVQAIQASGGTPLLVKYGCSLGDAVCLSFENAGRGMALGATGMMFLVAQNMRFDTSTLLWSAAVGEWSFWQWAILIITFGAMVWAVAAAVISGDRGELVSAMVRSFIAVAAVPLTLWVTGHLLNTVDQMTWYLMNRHGPLGLFSTLQSVMWAGGQANYFFAFLIDGLLMFGMVLLMLVFAFRNIALAALIMVGPVAWMIFPVRRIGPQWVVRYVSAVVVLLLTGPLTIGFLTLIINGLARVKTIWDPQSWPLLVGLVLVAFAPFAIFGLFSFAGAVAADSLGSRLGAHGARLSTNAARGAARIPTRMGGLPAGVSSGGAAAVGAGSGGGGASAAGGSKRPATTQSATGAGSSGASSQAQGRPGATTTSRPIGSTGQSTVSRPPSPPTAPPPPPEGSSS